MDYIECPKPAYDRLVKSGIITTILDKKEKVSNCFYEPFGYEGAQMIKKAHKEIHNSQGEQREIFKNLLDFRALLDEEDWFPAISETFFLQCPSYLGYLVLERDLLKFADFGFPTRRSLEESITSFCIGERHLFSSIRDCDIWRRDNYKFEISLNIHGDLYASQKDVSGKDIKQKGLFGKIEEFDAIKKDVQGTAIFAYQDWSQFLMASLLYAKEIKKEKIPEIVNWRKTLEKAGGGRGTNTAECEFGRGNLGFDFLFNLEILKENKAPSVMPLEIYSRNINFLPILKNGNLVYLQESKEGSIKIYPDIPFFKEKQFRQCLEYTKADLPKVLIATYKYFARDRSLLPKIMDKFNKNNSKN